MAPTQILTTFNTVPYSPEHLIRNTTEAFISNTTENHNHNSSRKPYPNLHATGIADTSWVPSTTWPFSSTTKEVKSGGWGVFVNSLRKPWPEKTRFA